MRKSREDYEKTLENEKAIIFMVSTRYITGCIGILHNHLFMTSFES